MNFKMLCWNMRGLNGLGKRAAVKSFVKGATSFMLCLQEIKLEMVDKVLIRKIWGGHYVEWEYLPARGSLGGILLCWDGPVVVR